MSRFCNQDHLSTTIILIYESYESNRWVTFEDQPAKKQEAASSSLRIWKQPLNSLCSQHLLKHLKKNKSCLHLDGSYLRPQPWEHHHHHCHQLQPGIGGDLHDYLLYDLSTLNQSSPYDLSANLTDLQAEPWEHHHLHCIAVICGRNGRRFAWLCSETEIREPAERQKKCPSPWFIQKCQITWTLQKCLLPQTLQKCPSLVSMLELSSNQDWILA